MAESWRFRCGRVVVALLMTGAVALADAPSVTLEWDPNPESDLAGYNVYRSTESGGTYTLLNAAPIPSTLFTDADLTAGVTYYYVCTAVGGDGLESGFSNEISLSVADPTNTPPVAVDDSVTLPEDSAALIDVTANDLDADGDTLAVVGFGQALFGLVEQVATDLRYVPVPNFHGADSFSYTVSDGRGGEETATVSISVLPVNDAPETQTDVLAVSSTDPVVIDVLANDSDPDGDTLTVQSVTQSQGQVTNNGTSITYTPAAGFSGIDTFTYVAVDGQGGSTSGTVQVDVNNNAPIPEDDFSVTEEDSVANLDVTSNDVEPDGDPVTIVGFTQPAEGVVVAFGNGLRYSPPLDFHGSVNFEYTVTDGRGAEASAQVTVEVTSVNDKPKARPDQVRLCRKKCGQGASAEGSVPDSSGVLAITVLENDTDVDGDPLTVESISGAIGTVTTDGNVLLYEAAPDFSGTDSFEYTIVDGEGGSASATVRVIVDAENRTPTPYEDWATTAMNEPVMIGVLFNDSDPDGDLLELIAVSSTSAGELTIGGYNILHFTPRNDFVGTAEFTYTVSDGELEATAQVNVDVRETLSGDLVFPVSISSGQDLVADPLVGVALLNPDEQDAFISMSAMTSDGSEIDGGVLEEPLLPRGQRAFLTQEITSDDDAAMLSINGQGKSLHGFFSVVDVDASRMDAIGATPDIARILYLHQIRHLPEEETVIQIFNPSIQVAELTVTLFDTSGTAVSGVFPVLAPRGSMRGNLTEIFGELPDLEEGYVEIRGNVPVHGFAVRATLESFSAEAATRAQPSDELIAPHFFFNREGVDGSRLRLLNPGGATVQIEVEAFANDGLLLAETTFNLQARELIAEDIDQMLDFEDVTGDQVSGYLRVRATSFLGGHPSLLGSIEFSGFERTAATTLPLSRLGNESTLFPHLAQTRDNSIYTGLAILNPLSEGVGVSIEAFTADGLLSASRQLELGPGERIVDLLVSDRLFGDQFEQSGGHLQVRSSLPLSTTAIIGSAAGGLLSAIEGQRMSVASLPPVEDSPDE